MRLDQSNIQIVLDILRDLSAACGETTCGIVRSSQAAQVISKPSIAVPTVNGPNASFVDPRGKAAADLRRFQEQTGLGLQTVLTVADALRMALADPKADPAPSIVEQSGRPLALAGG